MDLSDVTRPRPRALPLLTAFSTDTLTVCLPGEDEGPTVTDLLGGKRFAAGAIPLYAYDTLWLTV